jgi:hypothetical protein
VDSWVTRHGFAPDPPPVDLRAVVFTRDVDVGTGLGRVDRRHEKTARFRERPIYRRIAARFDSPAERGNV